MRHRITLREAVDDGRPEPINLVVLLNEDWTKWNAEHRGQSHSNSSHAEDMSTKADVATTKANEISHKEYSSPGSFSADDHLRAYHAHKQAAAAHDAAFNAGGAKYHKRARDAHRQHVLYHLTKSMNNG